MKILRSTLADFLDDWRHSSIPLRFTYLLSMGIAGAAAMYVVMGEFPIAVVFLSGFLLINIGMLPSLIHITVRRRTNARKAIPT